MIQTVSKALAIRSLVLVALCATLFSFSEKIGADSFTIYLNDKLILQQYVGSKEGVKSLSLKTSDANDILKIQYSHCGKTGIKRNITIQDGHNKVLKTWQFSDNASAVMDFKVKEVLALPKNTGDQRLQLVYSSIEIPKGMVLAGIMVSDDNKASLK